MTIIHVCKINDVVVFSSVSEDDCMIKCRRLIKSQAQRNLLIARSVPEELLGKNIENILTDALGITEADIALEMQNIENITCSEYSV